MSSIYFLRETVEQTVGVIDSAIILITGLHERLLTALENESWDEVEDLANQIGAQRDALAAAVAMHQLPVSAPPAPPAEPDATEQTSGIPVADPADAG